MDRTCSPRGPSRQCTPGCSHAAHPSGRFGNVQWCDDVHRDQWPCAWRPSDVGQMLQAREVIRARGVKPAHKDFDDRKFYVEMIFDAQASAKGFQPAKLT